jgi:hypothetical protein
VKALHAKIGELTLANDFWEGALGKAGLSPNAKRHRPLAYLAPEASGERTGGGGSWGSVYYLPRPVSPEYLAIIRRMDALDLEFPFGGSRMLRDFLRQESIATWPRPCCEPDEQDGNIMDTILIPSLTW